MINRKDTPAPSMQRAIPPRPLSLRPAAQSNHNDSTPQTPQTPRNKTRAKRASKVQRPTPRETYMGSNARAVADENVRDERISHDLSLTDNARHSVVDNMLMSLNPDQPKLFTPPKDRPILSSGSESTAPPKSAPRHLHSSSFNSDFSFPSDDPPQQFSGNFPRGHRSNSSSNFQSGLSRINSVRAEGEKSNSPRSHRYQPPEVGSGGVERPARASRKGSKSSGSSSVDMGHIGQPRIPHWHTRRSASFDLSERLRVLDSGSSSATHPPLPSSLPQADLYNDLEAAPTPTVPGGPRKDRSTLFPPQIASSTPSLQRRNSNKSSRNQVSKKKKIENFGDQPIPLPSNTPITGSRRASKRIQPPPAFLKSRNPSPVRQYSEPLMAQRLESNASTKEATKERPGFFRRVFGSSRNDMHQLQTQPPKPTAQASSREGFAITQRTARIAPSDEGSHQLYEAAQPPLVKKPSSFFRRRKKSVSEQMPPPVLPLNLSSDSHPHPIADRDQRSPTSSLRQVMNPYLDNPMRSDARQFAGTLGHANAHSQTHTLQAKGIADSVRQNHNPVQDAGLTHPLRQPREIPLPRREVPPERARLKSDDTYSTKPHDKSFFYDDSSNETRILGPSDDVELLCNDTVRLEHAPRSNPVDMKLRREDEDRPTKSNKGQQPVCERPVERPMDSPKHRELLTTRTDSLPASMQIAPTKTEVRDWLAPAQLRPQLPSPTASMKDADRVWLQPETSDNNVSKHDMSFPNENPEVSPISDYHSADSTLLPLMAKDDIHFPEPTTEDATHKLSVDIDPAQPSEADRVQARRLFDGDETLTTKPAAWLGEPDPARGYVRQAYMELFELQNLTILAALRNLCGKLFLKGEAQQVDRVLDAFSTRWCACNPNHGFKATDVVHTICYSVLLLNTDLHQEGIETKMTRTQFLKNILPTIRRVVTDAAPDAFVNPRASTLPSPRPWADSSRAGIKSTTSHEAPEARRSFEGQRPIYRLSQRPSDQTTYSSITPHTPIDLSNSMGDCGPLVKAPFHGKLSTWENQVEIVLKDFYNSIRQHPLPLYGSEPKEAPSGTPQASNGISAMTNSMLRRTPSMLSKAASENLSYSRGRPNDGRLGTGRWQSKNRSRPRIYPASSIATSRRSSLDEQSSVTSPSVTSAWSKFSSLGKTQTSLSIDSFATNFPQGVYPQSIGFANALSQAIIREEGTGGDEQSLHAAPLLEDESLELAGAPWAKEGFIKHKHLSVDKRAKDRNWVESFGVIEKGYMRLFSFSMNAKSLRNKAKNQKAAGGIVGGGNWADSAETLGTFLLRQTIASELPSPGYSKTRPHVWALELPTGAVHLFQVGTPEIVREFVTTANYWSARLSKEPMVGGISNIEYGWGDSVINTAILNTDNDVTISNVGPRPSLQSSIRSARSSIDQAAFRPRLPGDKVVITDWKPPQQSMVASVLMEVDQLKGLLTYVKNIADELEKHNKLRAAMLLAVS